MIHPDTIIAIEYVFKVKLLFKALDIIYKRPIYIIPIIPPVIKPFFSSYIQEIDVPIRILTAVITIITGLIVSSEIDVYDKIIPNIKNDIMVIPNENNIPLNILDNLFVLLFSTFSILLKASLIIYIKEALFYSFLK